MNARSKDARESFFRNDISAPKFDPSLRTREARDRGDREYVEKSDKEALYNSRQEKTSQNAATTNHSSHHGTVKEFDGYVGFANLPNQVYRKSVKRGFEFTLMVVGQYSQFLKLQGKYM